MTVRLSRPALGAILLSALVAAPVARAATSGSSTTTTSTTTANLLTGDTASLAGGAGTWEAEAGTTSLARSGVLATTAEASGWTVTGTGATTPAVADRVYRGQFSVQATSTERSVVPYLYFYGSSGQLLDKVKGEVTQDRTSGWTTVTPVVGVAPAGTASVALASLTWGTGAGEVHELSSPVLTAATAPRTSLSAPLSVSGNRVLDARGVAVTLRGINRIGFETSPTAELTAADLAQAKRWGANMVRLPLSSAFWLTSSCHYDAGYAARVDAAVSAVTSRGMLALVDLHTNTPTGCGTVKQQVMADSTATAFWTSVATRYRSNPLVAFDLYNEPHDVSDAVWLGGGTVTTDGVTWRAVGMQSMYDTVRKTGAKKNLVFVSGNNWGNTLPAKRVTGTNVVYAAHVYTCTAAVDDTCAQNPLDPTPILSTWVSPSSTVPVVVTEFGWPAIGSGTYNSNVIAYAAAHRWGWTAFAWDGTPYGQFSLLSTAGAGTGYQPTPAGMPVLWSLTR